jgi:catechol 2,3-dioxygenase-like lactoylglutathione lyase family enzyme|tara:strand:+ start:3274 stop:4113 length:840 start_codon:yes stop_codon:yes gene_type:complete
MISTLDHLIIAVKDLDQAEKNYKKILGTNPVWRGRHKSLGTANSIFNFKNTYLELLTSDGEGLGAELIKNLIQENGDGLAGIVFGVDDMLQTVQQLKQEGYQISDPAEGEGSDNETNKVRKWHNLFLPPELTRGLFSFIIQHHDGELPSHKEYAKDSINKLDHVVINTNNADSFIEIYRDVFKIRLALDKTIEHWNSRMLFFRLNKTTIEVVERSNNEKPKDTLWGLAWEVESIEDTHKRLVSEGVEVSDIKAGLKENTLVATVKSHTHNVPTLIIQHL